MAGWVGGQGCADCLGQVEGGGVEGRDGALEVGLGWYGGHGRGVGGAVQEEAYVGLEVVLRRQGSAGVIPGWCWARRVGFATTS